MEWPLKYIDDNGIVETKIYSDGKNLRTRLRGVIFEGTDLDCLSPEKETESKLLECFTLSDESLCNCRIEGVIDFFVQSGDTCHDGSLEVILELGKPEDRGFLDKEALNLTLSYNNKVISGSGNSGWFEDELNEIQKQLPEGDYMKVCINCAYSDYSPYGHGTFGGMMCFKNVKEEYLKVKTKDEFWSVHDNFDKLVQETYYCDEFELRKPGTGYRG